MARRKHSAPRRGTLALRPRKRASRLVPRIKTWPNVTFDKPQLLAFLGYKAGMTHLIIIDDRPGRPTYGQEVFLPVTVIETPPMIPVAARFYEATVAGFKTLTELWVRPPEELEIWRRVKTFSVDEDHRKRVLDKVMSNIDKIARVAVLLASQPKLAGGLSKKIPDILEVKIGGGDIKAQIDYALNILGKEIRITDVFKPGQFIDVIGVTKGKGFAGVIKRFGVKELPRWHKHRKGSRRVGARSPGIGALSTVPQPGQLGFARRTQHNKRIIMIGSNGYEITPSGGFPHYGIVRSDYVVLSGTVQGPPKRPIVLRWPVRPPSWVPEGPPKIVYVSLESKI